MLPSPTPSKSATVVNHGIGLYYAESKRAARWCSPERRTLHPVVSSRRALAPRNYIQVIEGALDFVHIELKHDPKGAAFLLLYVHELYATAYYVNVQICAGSNRLPRVWTTVNIRWQRAVVVTYYTGSAKRLSTIRFVIGLQRDGAYLYGIPSHSGMPLRLFSGVRDLIIRVYVSFTGTRCTPTCVKTCDHHQLRGQCIQYVDGAAACLR